jgi:hypothetical protein
MQSLGLRLVTGGCWSVGSEVLLHVDGAAEELGRVFSAEESLDHECRARRLIVLEGHLAGLGWGLPAADLGQIDGALLAEAAALEI